MRRILALLAVVTMTAAACGDSDGGDATAPAATEAPAATDAPAATEAPAAAGTPADLAITSVVFGETVTITNLGSGSVDLANLWLCNRPSYTPLPEQMLGPGESVDVGAAALGSLSADGGEAALYTSNDFGDPGSLIDYVAWGSGGGRGSVAVDAGQWPTADEAVAAGAGSISAPSGGNSAADWS